MEQSLEDWIKSELTVDITQELAKHKETIKNFIKLIPDGSVLVMDQKKNFSAKDKIALYMIGKLYSNYAKYSSEKTVKNKELEDALGLPEGTVKNSLFRLRKDNYVMVVAEGVHQIKFDKIGDILNEIKGKMQKSG